MQTLRLLGLLLLLSFAFPCISSGQIPPPPVSDSLPVDSMTIDSSQTPVVHKDTILFVPPSFQGELPVTDSSNLEKQLRQSPTGALFKSMLIPGWGQLSNGRPVKAAIFAGLQIWCIGAAIHYGSAASDFRDSYEAATDLQNRRDYYGLYKDRRQERNKYLFFLGLTTLVSAFDAYVDAHLTGSPAHPPQRLGLQLQPDSQGVSASLALRF